MKTRLFVSFALALALLGLPATAYAGPAEATVYYLSLGDSLAAGTQPGQLFTDQGYTDQLFATLKATRPKLQHVKLGCPGETSATMISGGLPREGRGAVHPCDYPHGTQLAEAVNFLQAHREFVTLVTIDIGANDVLPCFAAGDQICFAHGVAAIQTNLPQILAALRDAAGPATPIIGMNYYDPFLALWLQGPTGQAQAVASLALVGQVNALLRAIYGGARSPVANVQDAFHSTDFTPVATPFGIVPRNVFLVCVWTWMCTIPPGPDIHPNATGYGVIAAAFVAVIP